MLAGEFLRKIRKLSPKLNIFCGDDDTKGAGLFQVVNGEYEQIIGVDKNWIPEKIMYDEFGHIVKSGWLRVVRNLIKRKFVRACDAERVFDFKYRPWERQKRAPVRRDKINDAIEEGYKNGMVKHGVPALKRDEVMDISKEIKKNA